MSVSTMSRPPTAPPRRLLSTFACTLTLGVTGWLFTAFVAVHMIGNLKAYSGADAYNNYSHWLRTAFYPVLPHEGLLWLLRVVLAVALILHVGAAGIVWARGRRFRGPHRRRAYRAFGARTMVWTGLILLAFVIFHILDLTLGIAGPVDYLPATSERSFAYENTVASLDRPVAGGFYLITMAALAVHLVHGLWSSTTALGVTGPRLRRLARVVAYALGLGVAVGNATLPIAVWTGVLS